MYLALNQEEGNQHQPVKLNFICTLNIMSAHESREKGLQVCTSLVVFNQMEAYTYSLLS